MQNLFMLKKILLPLLGTLSLCSNEAKFPQTIDFGRLPTIEQGYYANFQEYLWDIGYYAFNYAPELAPFFAHLQHLYNIDAVVETGTLFGSTTIVFSSLFDEVHTIEIDNSLFTKANTRFQTFPNVKCHLGSSEKVFKELLPTLKGKRALFYLDAHWQNHWPLLEELEEISKTHKDNCIIVIDDFKVPGRRDIPHDYYNQHECSLEYAKKQLDKVFSSYIYHFLIPRSKLSRAKFIAIPKNWAD